MNDIIYYFESWVEQTPKAIAVSYNEQLWSYAELNNYANFIAESLIELGVQPLSVIAVAGHKSIEMVAAILAILKLNCSYLPLDLSLPEERIQQMLVNADSHLMISHGITSDLQAFTHVKHIVLDSSQFDQKQNFSNLNREINANSPAYVMHTSGSTGTPKGVVVPHRGVIRLLINTNYITICPHDSILFHSNTSFDAGIFEVWAALINGAQLVISPHLTGDISAIYKLCHEKNITILLLATGLFHIFSSMNVENLSQLRYLVVGGDVMHASAARRVISKNPHLTLINGYGPAENAVFTTCLVITNEQDIGNPVSIGRAITGTKVFLLDDNLNQVAVGEAGELYTSGSGVALGYINAPALTAEKFLTIPHLAGDEILYRTGDIVKQSSTGNYEFVGRRDNQVKIRGFRVELSEIESVISALNYVEDVFVSVIDSEHKRIAAFIKVDNHGASDIQDTKKKIILYLKDKLPSQCIPSYVEINDQFPLTTNGKLDRKMLQNSLSNKFLAQV